MTWLTLQVAPIPPNTPLDGIFAHGNITGSYTQVGEANSVLHCPLAIAGQQHSAQTPHLVHMYQ